MQKIMLMLKILLIVIMSGVPALSSEWEPVTDAEKSLKENALDPGAGALVLFKRGKIEVEDRGKSGRTKIETYVRIKILNESGREFANISIETDKSQRTDIVRGRTILPSGQVVPLDPSRVFRSQVYASGKQAAFFKTVFTVPDVEPGAIIEFQTEEQVDSFFIRPWIFDYPGLATLESTLSVTVLSERLQLQSHLVNTTRNKIEEVSGEPRVDDRGKLQKYQAKNYKAVNILPVREEPFAPPFRDQTLTILFAPVSDTTAGFGYYYERSLIDSWDSVGRVVWYMCAAASKKGKAAKNKAHELADHIPDEGAKLEAIYQFVQQNISSSGLQGVLVNRGADEVLASRHGDPDEINALFLTMLEEVKIKAHPLLLAARNWQSVVKAFPNFSQFSRIIAVVEVNGVSRVADPADPAAPFGEVPWYEQGIFALLVRQDNQKNVTAAWGSTPIGSPEHNATEHKLTSEILPDWNVRTEFQANFRGAPAVEKRRVLLEENREKINDILVEFFGMGLPGVEVTDIQHPDFRIPLQQLSVKALVKHQSMEEAGPGQHLVNPWIADRFETPMFKATERYAAVLFPYTEARSSTSVWRLPASIGAEQLPKEVHLSSDLAEFSHSCAQESETVTCNRKFTLKKLVLQTAEEYHDAKALFEQIARADQEVMVLHEK